MDSPPQTRLIADRYIVSHPPKRVILFAIMKELVLKDQWIREVGDYAIDSEKLEKLQEQLKSDPKLNSLEKRDKMDYMWK